MLIWIGLILLAAAGLTIGIERLMTHFNVNPAQPNERAGGIQDIGERVALWARRKR